MPLYVERKTLKSTNLMIADDKSHEKCYSSLVEWFINLRNLLQETWRNPLALNARPNEEQTKTQ